MKTRLFKRFKIFEGQFSGFRATTDAAAAGNVDDGDQESPGINVIELYLLVFVTDAATKQATVSAVLANFFKIVYFLRIMPILVKAKLCVGS